MFFIYVRWFLINGFFFSLFLYASYTSNENLINIPVFFAWLLSILSLFALADEVIEKRIIEFNNGKKFVDKNIDAIFDAIFLLSLLYYGYMWLSMFYLIHSSISYIYKTKVGEGALNV